MLVLTSILLSVVLLVMVVKSVQEMQETGWFAITSIGISLPNWLGVWLAVFPNVQVFIAQAAAALLVLGSYAYVQ